MRDANVLVGLETGDDAGVYRLSDDLAIIQTVDFITPIVDDPYTFGQIAAANSLSDVYAMGGTPITAMNVVCFPVKSQGISVLNEILQGGLDKMKEAGVALVGGHSVSDEEPKYGLSVTGIIHPSRIVTKAGAQSGDKLILTKPLGTGIVTTAIKGGTASKTSIDAVISSMTTLNKKASELMLKAGVHACTDITGFGLIGHICGMVEHSNKGIELRLSQIPIFIKARELAEAGMTPGGTRRNMEFYQKILANITDIDEITLDILFDPQTSGGLLMSIPPDKAEGLLKKLRSSGIKEAAIIGQIVDKPKGKIILRG